MSRIDELIQELCPEGVAFAHLADIAITVPGLTGKTKADFSDGNARFASYRNVFTNPSLNLESPDFVKVGPGERQNSVRKGDILITGSSESLDEVGMSSVVATEPGEPIYLNSFCFILRLKDPQQLLPGFSKHLFRSESIRKQIRGTASGVTRINISKPRFMKIRIPVPPLEVQREIVRILDQFTQLEAELEAELEARRRQYEHYRSVITQGDGSARLSALGDHIDFGGRNVAPDRMPETTVSIYSLPAFDRGIGPELTTPADVGSAKSRVAEPSLLVAKLNPHIPRVWRVDAPDEGAYASPEFYQLIPKDSLSLEYLEHLVGASMSKLAGMVTGSTNSHKRLQREHIASLMVRIPSLREQAEASALLTRMHNLVNDLSVGLPAELAARRKQYEYYRDKLLTFKELEP